MVLDQSNLRHKVSNPFSRTDTFRWQLAFEFRRFYAAHPLSIPPTGNIALERWNYFLDLWAAEVVRPTRFRIHFSIQLCLCKHSPFRRLWTIFPSLWMNRQRVTHRWFLDRSADIIRNCDWKISRQFDISMDYLFTIYLDKLYIKHCIHIASIISIHRNIYTLPRRISSRWQSYTDVQRLRFNWHTKSTPIISCWTVFSNGSLNR